ncbi:uncharacterized protein C11orf97 homolog isoform X2 [Canis lupus dingo]|uniref:uncharacterized protein C11orf97 homolog isoform X2 n=1 Tax=Canis lupus dingo TaxID=286419 RepID=UPI0020C4E313|nr:uncharacterized protein C11orf97 homolog isoform X2 [Canis lupus dingo]
MRNRQKRESESSRGRSRLHAGSPTRDSIPGLQDQAPGQRSRPLHPEFAIQQVCAILTFGKKFLYSEPHKRIKEVLEEELYIKRDECHIKNPPAVALERIWSIKRNLPVGNLKPELPSRNSLLPQTTYYSRHGGLRR